jgi:dihydroorotase-like cyclic amidohydrolase
MFYPKLSVESSTDRLAFVRQGRGVPLLFHAEMDAVVSAAPSKDGSEGAAPDATLYSSFLASRPDAYETTAIELIVQLGREFPSVPLHIVHLSSAEALPTIRQAKLDGVNLTVETCYHYLWCINFIDSRTRSPADPPDEHLFFSLEAESIPDRHTEFVSPCEDWVRSL